MEKSIDYVKLVEQAQHGDKECLDRLAEAVRERLYTYVYRHTLADDLTNDIVQESILKMLEALGELRESEQFWPWLYKIVLNKIRLYYRTEQNHKTISDPDMDRQHKENHEVIASMVYQEFRETVFAAMRELKPEHRSIINMRCYDQMQYSQIGKVIGRSEFAAQKLFYRAKKSLKKKLARRGLGKDSLLMALVLFGKLTAPTKAAAASISVTSATVKVGVAASVAAIAASKTAILSLTTVGALTVGTMVATSEPKIGGVPNEKPTQSSYSSVIPHDEQAPSNSRESWYYYPSKTSSTVMMRIKGADSKGNHQYCQYLQNAEGNYYYDRRKNTVHIENYRMWQKDLSVWRLPTDSFELTEFLSQFDGRARPTEDVYRSQSGLLLVVKPPGQENSDRIQVTRHVNVLGEDYFKYDWPTNIKVVDNRDLMHKRGWTYFTVTGQIDGKEVIGSGRLPFVHGTSQSHWPWMKLRFGGEVFVNKDFTGFARPWAGLHTVDTIRRDAARQYISSETEFLSEETKLKVVLREGESILTYFINPEKDVVDRIVFSGDVAGELGFSYLQDIDSAGGEFQSPRTSSYDILEDSGGMGWLIDLAEKIKNENR
jgi:RNA polymerase sigma-70 factor (ECF subfamily)